MALNYSHRPVFADHISENNLWSSRTLNGLAEGVSEMYGDGFPRQWRASQGEMEDWCFSFWSDTDRCCPPESHHKDIVDLLPSDPFGMDIVTGWYGGFVGSTSQENYDLFAGWNLLWSTALKSQPLSSLSQGFEKLDAGLHSVPVVQFDQKLNGISEVNEYEAREMEGSSVSYDIGYQPAVSEGVMGLSNESTSCSNEVQFEEEVEGAAQSEEAPHEALKFCLLYLGLKDLLSVEGVCSSLRSEVREDSLLWKTIHIDQPLNEKITDDLLLKLTCRADGDLRCLSLIDCPKITDECIRHILETNPRLMKLFVPGCTRLTIDGILNNIRAHNSNKVVPGIKHLRIGGRYDVTHEHFEELKFLLGTNDGGNHKPHVYHKGNFYLPHDDERAIDIERCPKCEKFKLVYNCPAEGCQVKDNAPQACRACKMCIPRCAHCGRCIDDNEYEETFCLDLLCSDCYKQQRNYQNRLNKKIDPYGVRHEPSGHDHA
ncbi:hypothetical protein ACS0TY_009178 [Phlomoides rotata]